MYSIHTRSPFDMTANAICNFISCKGRDGNEVADVFKEAFPDNFKEYSKLKPGKLGTLCIINMGINCDFPFIINMFIKDSWRQKLDMTALYACLLEIKQSAQKFKWSTINFPYVNEIPFKALTKMLNREFLPFLFTELRVFVDDKSND